MLVLESARQTSTGGVLQIHIPSSPHDPPLVRAYLPSFMQKWTFCTANPSSHFLPTCYSNHIRTDYFVLAVEYIAVRFVRLIGKNCNVLAFDRRPVASAAGMDEGRGALTGQLVQRATCPPFRNLNWLTHLSCGLLSCGDSWVPSSAPPSPHVHCVGQSSTRNRGRMWGTRVFKCAHSACPCVFLSHTVFFICLSILDKDKIGIDLNNWTSFRNSHQFYSIIFVCSYGCWASV